MLPLSRTPIPFRGTCWVTRSQLHWAKKLAGHVSVILDRHHPVTDSSGRYLISTRGMPFTALPLAYLDWLIAQTWLFPDFEHRLRLYLKATDRYRHELPDPDRDGEPTPPDYHQDRWHGQPFPKDEPPDLPDAPIVTPSTAWGIIADAIITLTECQDIHDFLELDRPTIAKAAGYVNVRTRKELRDAFRTCRQRLQHLQMDPIRPHEFADDIIERYDPSNRISHIHAANPSPRHIYQRAF